MPTTAQPRALALVQEEHQAILSLFEGLGRVPAEERRERIDEAMVRLDIHQQLKRELLYPALEAADADAVEELRDAHEELEEMLDELDEIDAEEEEDEEDDEEDEEGEDDGETGDFQDEDEEEASDYSELVDQLRAHFDEEEETLGELAGKAEIDLDSVGKQMEARREELRRELGETGALKSDAAA